MKGIISLLPLIILMVACSQNTNRQEFNPVAENKPAQTSPITSKQASAGMKLTKPTELLPEIASKYSGIKITVINKEDNSESEINAPFGEKISIVNTGLSIEVSSYFTSFTMVNGGVQNVSMDENNPAAKVTISDNEEIVFDGWLFQQYPDMHPFEHPTWRIILTGAVIKE